MLINSNMGFAETRSNIFNLRGKKSSTEAQPTSITEQEGTKRASISQRWSERTGKDAPLTASDEQTTEILKTARHVLVQVQEAQRLRALKKGLLEPSESTWIDSTIEDTAAAAMEVIVFLEPFRIEKQTNNGKLSLTTQLRWVYRENQRVQEKKNRLSMCHNSLMPVLFHLQRLQAPEPSFPLRGSPTVFELESQVTLAEDARDLAHHRRPPSSYQEPRGEAIRVPTVPTKRGQSQEMLDLLAWRHSKGPQVSTTCAPSALSDTSSSIG